MHVHTVACFAVNRLRKEGCGLACLNSSILNHILNNHGVVCHRCHLTKLNFNFHLTGTANFMVMIFYFNACFFEHQAHITSEVIADIMRLVNVITTLLRYLITCVLACITGIPLCLLRVKGIRNLLGLYIKINTVKHMELKFRSDDHLICNTGGLHVLYRMLGHISRVLIKPAVGRLVNDKYIANHRNGLYFCKRIKHCTCKIRNEYHITLLNRSKPIVRTVKSNTIFHQGRLESALRNCDVSPSSVKVDHLKIDHLYVVFRAILLCFIKCLKHFLHLPSISFLIYHEVSQIIRNSGPYLSFSPLADDYIKRISKYCFPENQQNLLPLPLTVCCSDKQNRMHIAKLHRPKHCPNLHSFAPAQPKESHNGSESGS